MKKVVCFLYGNSNNLKLENNATIDEYKKLDENLLKLKEVNDADSLVFSLVTDDSYENVRDTKAVLDDFFVPPISSRKNFFKEGYINDSSIGLQSGGKCGSIMDYICEIKKDNEIKHIYYLDDCEFSKEVVSSFITDNNLDDQYTYIPLESTTTLKETNELLTSIINNKKMVKE